MRICLVVLAVLVGGVFDTASLVAASEANDDVWCRNSNNQKVEWFIVYKAPKTASTNKRANRYDLQGTEYGYIDSRMSSNPQGFVNGAHGIYSEQSNPLANSLERLIKRQKGRTNRELTYIVYNDQPPSELSNSTANGHTKGIVLFGPKSGLWLLHSVPRFPENLFTGKYSFPDNARENGQMLLCITFAADKLKTIAGHLLKQNPNMYAASAPAAVRRANEELDLLLNKKYPRGREVSRNDVLTAINGTSFTAFAKGGRANKDVYSGIIAPTLQTDLFVETWRNGKGGRLPSDCLGQYKTTDIQKIALKVSQKTMRWNSQEDHSKWAVGDKGNWVCIGSINRMLSQYRRGGETLCLQHPGVHALFAGAIEEYAPCNVGGIQTRGKTQLIEDLLRHEGEDKAGDDAGLQDKSSSSGAATTSPPTTQAGRALQTQLARMWEAQKKKIMTEVEGIRAVLG